MASATRKNSAATFLAALSVMVLMVGLYTWGPTAATAERVVTTLRDLGPLGAAAFAAIYALAATLMIPATPFPLTAGFLWGPWVGFLVAWAGELLGAMLSFWLGRTLLQDRARALAARYPLVGALDDAVEASGFRFLVLVRLSPLVPFGVLNYGLGVSAVPASRFALATAVGVIPASVVLVMAGASVTRLTEALQGDAPMGWGETLLTWGGLLATVAVTVVISRATRRALARRTA